MKQTDLIFLKKAVLSLLTLLTTMKVAWASPLVKQEEWEKKVTVTTLKNGLTILIVERHDAPVFSAFLRVDVGAVNEPLGQTGLAHMFEHMAFKGTDVIGTNHYDKEKLAIDKIERTYQLYVKEKNKVVGQDKKKLAELESAFKQSMEEAEPFVENNQFSKIVEEAGGVGLNAFTNHTETGYMISFPKNRFELWAYLESERIRRPVMRQFYKERNVVWEERRMRTESSPVGKLFEQFLAAAFTAHPYGRPVIGFPSDLDHFSMTEAKEFWEKYYVPSNMVLAVVGDVYPKEALPVLEAYFGRLPASSKPEPFLTSEPPQRVEKNLILQEDAEPFYVEGYHRGNFLDKDDAVYDVIASILGSGRTSRFYRALVQDQKIASFVSVESCMPGDKYPCLFLVYSRPMKGKQIRDVRAGIHKELFRLKNERVSQEELRSVKNRFQVGLLRSMDDNMGLATMFASVQQKYGDYRKIFEQLEQIERVSSDDILRVAKGIFVDENRTSAQIERKAPIQNKVQSFDKGKGR